jgi:hypothetical protein
MQLKGQQYQCLGMFSRLSLGEVQALLVPHVNFDNLSFVILLGRLVGSRSSTDSILEKFVDHRGVVEWLMHCRSTKS